MKQRVWSVAALAIALLLVAGPTASAEGGTWVSEDHRVHGIGDNAMFFAEGATEVNLADLADGETRVIGAGEKQVTATRDGDTVTISRAAAGKHGMNVTCVVGRDTCKVLTFADDPEKVALVVQHERVCKDGEGDCDDMNVMVLGEGPGGHGEHHVIHKLHGEHGDGMHVIKIRKTVRCDDDGNCTESEEPLGDDEGLAEVIIQSLGDGAHGRNVFIHKSDQVTLRCSEGDTTMSVEKAEADDVFLCPKHSTPLVKVEAHPRMIRRKVIRDKDGK